MRYLWLYFDGTGPIGCGFRRVLVTGVGRKWAQCFYVPGLVAFKLPLAKLAAGKPVTDSEPKRLAKIVRVNMRERDRLALRYRRTAAKAVAAWLASAREYVVA